MTSWPRRVSTHHCACTASTRLVLVICCTVLGLGLTDVEAQRLSTDPSVDERSIENCTAEDIQAEQQYGFKSRVIYVHGEVEGRRLAAMTNSTVGLRNIPCGNAPETACYSIRHVLAQMPSFCKPKPNAMLSYGWGKFSTYCLDGCLTEIRLLARKPSCGVLVGSFSLLIAHSVQIAMSIGNDIDNKECGAAGLIFEDVHPYEKQVLMSKAVANLEIYSSSDIVFKHIQFYPGTSQPAMVIDFGIRIFLEETVFITNNKQHGLVILNSVDVMLENVTFVGEEGAVANSVSNITGRDCRNGVCPSRFASNNVLSRTGLQGAGSADSQSGTRSHSQNDMRASSRDSSSCAQAGGECQAGASVAGGKSALWIGYDNSSLLLDGHLWELTYDTFRYLSDAGEQAIRQQCLEQRKLGYSVGRSTVTLMNVNFEKMRSRPRRRESQKTSRGLKQGNGDVDPLGVGAEIHFAYNSKTGFVLFRNCSFREIINGRGVLHASPVYVRFSSLKDSCQQFPQPRRLDVFGNNTETNQDENITCQASPGDAGFNEKNSLVFDNCSFEDNIGYLGGALRVHIDGNRRQTIYNALRLGNSTFRNNTAELEGGAMFVHTTGILQTYNTIVLENAEFEDNVAGIHGKGLAPGGAILLKSDSRADKYPNLTHMMGSRPYYLAFYGDASYCNPDSRSFYPAELQEAQSSFTLENCSFIGNAGLGAVYSRLAMVLFKGAT